MATTGYQDHGTVSKLYYDLSKRYPNKAVTNSMAATPSNCLEHVQSARPAIDFRTPPSYPHVTIKPKKQQFEKERLQRIEVENVRLLQKLGDIMRTKRLENFWQAPRPNFLNREKLFETRPHTSHPKIVEIYAPAHYEISLKSPNSKTARRCPTCSGRPERTELAIPEKRIPWEPPKKSVNTFSLRETFLIRKKCLHCGHLKQNVD